MKDSGRPDTYREIAFKLTPTKGFLIQPAIATILPTRPGRVVVNFDH